MDEVQVSLSKVGDDNHVAFGREMYRSAFEVISANSATVHSINLAASEVIRECTTILLASQGQHTLKPSYLSGTTANSIL